MWKSEIKEKLTFFDSKHMNNHQYQGPKRAGWATEGRRGLHIWAIDMWCQNLIVSNESL